MFLVLDSTFHRLFCHHNSIVMFSATRKQYHLARDLVYTALGRFSKLLSYSGTIFSLCDHLGQETLLVSSRW